MELNLFVNVARDYLSNGMSVNNLSERHNVTNKQNVQIYLQPHYQEDITFEEYRCGSWMIDHAPRGYPSRGATDCLHLES